MSRLLLIVPFLLPVAAGAQGARLTVEPQLGIAPEAPVWGRSTTSTRYPLVSGGGVVTVERTTEIRRDPMATVGARLAASSGSGRWLLAVHGSGGRTRVHYAQREQTTGGFLPPGSPVLDQRFALSQDATLLAIGATVARAGRWRGLALELGGGGSAQLLRLREQRSTVTRSEGGVVRRDPPRAPLR